MPTLLLPRRRSKPSRGGTRGRDRLRARSAAGTGTIRAGGADRVRGVASQMRSFFARSGDAVLCQRVLLLDELG